MNGAQRPEQLNSMDEIVASENAVTVTEPAPESAPQPAPVASPAKGNRWAPLIALAGWIFPGLGHAILGRWGRALAFFIAVGGLAILGYLLRGQVFPPDSGDPFGTVGFLADVASGVFYFLAHFVEGAGADIGRAAGDYGTRFIAAAGVVNILGVFDAYEIARGRRN